MLFSVHSDVRNICVLEWLTGNDIKCQSIHTLWDFDCCRLLTYSPTQSIWALLGSKKYYCLRNEKRWVRKDKFNKSHLFAITLLLNAVIVAHEEQQAIIYLNLMGFHCSRFSIWAWAAVHNILILPRNCPRETVTSRHRGVMMEIQF